MIIIGYQGIGKSTLAMKNAQYVDLESNCFFHDGKRPDNWYVYYCNIAEHLSRQGKRVFVSSHDVVRKMLKKYSSAKVIAIVPAPSLKAEWLQKLKRRAEESCFEKDWKAYWNAENRYEANVAEIRQDFPYLEIGGMGYNLQEMIEEAE